jgi:hypothetical protein
MYQAKLECPKAERNFPTDQLRPANGTPPDHDPADDGGDSARGGDLGCVDRAN